MDYKKKPLAEMVDMLKTEYPKVFKGATDHQIKVKIGWALSYSHEPRYHTNDDGTKEIVNKLRYEAYLRTIEELKYL